MLLCMYQNRSEVLDPSSNVLISATLSLSGNIDHFTACGGGPMVVTICKLRADVHGEQQVGICERYIAELFPTKYFQFVS